MSPCFLPLQISKQFWARYVSEVGQSRKLIIHDHTHEVVLIKGEQSCATPPSTRTWTVLIHQKLVESWGQGEERVQIIGQVHHNEEILMSLEIPADSTNTLWNAGITQRDPRALAASLSRGVTWHRPVTSSDDIDPRFVIGKAAVLRWGSLWSAQQSPHSAEKCSGLDRWEGGVRERQQLVERGFHLGRGVLDLPSLVSQPVS